MNRIVLGVSVVFVACGAPEVSTSPVPPGSVGGGSGGGVGGGGGGAAMGGGSGTSGWLLYKSAGAMVALNMSTSAKISAPLDVEAGSIGFGGGVISDVIWDQYADTAQIELRRFDGARLVMAGQLPVVSVADGYASGAATPSPDQSRFTLMSRESAGLSEPYYDYVSVLTANGDALTKVRDLVDPLWLGPNTVVAGGVDGLYTFAADGTAGPSLLAATGGAPGGLALSNDGKTFVFVQDATLFTMAVDGTGLTQVTQQSIGTGWAAFSPDGTKLAVKFGSCTIGFEAPVVIISATAAMQNLAQDATPAWVNTCTAMQWVP